MRVLPYVILGVQIAWVIWFAVQARRLHRCLRMARAEYEVAVRAGQEIRVLRALPRIVLIPDRPGAEPIWLRVPREQLEEMSRQARN